ncbi:MAG: ribokinase [Thermomicrobiales bacterium]|nr:ribokinase [Thermomicrobiales bacterium]
MTEASGRVLIAGAINTDLVAHVRKAPEAGETVTGSSFAVFGGGKGANQAVAAARSGANTAMLGAVGEDDFGRQRLADLSVEMIDVGGVTVTDRAASGVALIIVDETGQNRIAYVPGATATITPDQAIAALHRFQPRVLLTTLELPARALESLFEEALVIGATIINNATPEPSEGRKIAALADILIVNETEASELLAVGPGERDWLAVAHALRGLGPRAAIVTLGAAGAVVAGERVSERLPAPKVEVVDSTGAGDAFAGAFAARLASGADILTAARVGVIAGSLAVTKAGAQPSMPRREEIEQMLGHA